MVRIPREQLDLFNELHNSRTEDYKTFSKRSYRGLLNSTIYKYSEPAHFVYELLQNADDAEATEVYITVNREELLFKHNGKKHFDITPEDAIPSGDINSITGIGDSSKTDFQNKIGKFGVGFKAVFQYTNTPEIFDDTFKFKIENLIIPTLLEYDRPERKNGETLFVLPFKDKGESYNEIVKKLDRLQNPLLFLRTLNKISLRIDRTGGGKFEEVSYEKQLVETVNYSDGIILEKYKLKEPLKTSSIFLFSQEAVVPYNDIKTKHYICVGFYYDEIENRLITDTTSDIYCFFPTKETFKTCFVSHAPFLLTDNRQNLKPGDSLNKSLVKLLGRLAAKSVLHLRDYGIQNNNLLINENITEILPEYHKSYYDDYDEVFETPIKDAFDEIVDEEAIFLSRGGKYLSKDEAYKGSPRELVELLNQKQFNELLDTDDNADFLKWELSQNLNKEKSVYSDIFNEYTSEKFAEDVTADFMSIQDMKWVIRMYNFLRTSAPKLWKVTSDQRTKDYRQLPFRIAPIIKTQKGNWVAPYLIDKSRNVYLPLKRDTDSSYNFVDEDYLMNEHAKRFFDELELKEPDEFDYINSIILERYRKPSVVGSQEDINDDIIVIISYWMKIKDTVNSASYLSLLRRDLKLRSEYNSFKFANDLHFPITILKEYLRGSDIDQFDKEYYRRVYDKYGDLVNSFLIHLGVNSLPKIIKTAKENRDYYSLSNRVKSQIPVGYSEISWIEFVDYHLDNFMNVITCGRMTKDISLYLWNKVLPAINFSLYENMSVSYKKKYYPRHCYAKCDSTFKDQLISLNWIYDQNGQVRNAQDITLETLDPDYDRNNGLIQFLKIEIRQKSIIELGGTEEQQKQQELGKQVQEASGGVLTDEETILAINEAKNKKLAKLNKNKPSYKSVQSSDSTDTEDTEQEELENKLKEKWEKKAQKENARPRSVKQNNDDVSSNNSPSRLSDDDYQPFFDDKNVSSNNDNEEKVDTKAEKNLKAKDKEAQESAEKTRELVRILEMMRLTPLYSFKWFKLYMELMHANKANIAERHIQLDFSEWEFICSDKLLHLSNPSQPVPSWIAESDKTQISTLSDNPFKINGLVVKSDEYSIDISIELDDELRKACSKARKIRVVADNSSNFIDSFESRFLQLGFEDDYNLKDNLTKDIKFIYGPPGTGKTTKVVEMIHNILENPSQKIDILVLTPTNKAADVVARKMVDDDICYDYLTRFGATESLYLIEDAAVVTNRDTTDMDLLDHNIVVTTAARFAYDCVQPDDTFICDYPWDYIIIDEASMMDLLTITYILYKGSPSQFIISGDPMQIQPVSQNDMPAYNVYDLVGLHSFADAVNNYKQYEVITLQTQHRSVPSIGDLVSKYAYNGIVKADPERAPQKPIILDGIDVRDINFLGFEVKEFDLISGLGAIEGSAFHLYSAIFTYNMAEYTISQLGKHFPNKEYSIGIVCPYRAEADAIKQMLDNRPIDSEFCHVTCGTVHSFQGDECDIMFVVLNPPEQCTRGAHINNKNIINVAMSRARDYLFFVLPKGQQKGFTLKNDLGRLLSITQRRVLDCSLIEEIMFGSADHIYSNTNVTCHKPVNVYYEDTAIYEVRMSDDALDIKINDQ